MFKRNPVAIYFAKCLPDKPVFFSSILRRVFQSNLNRLLTNSMEKFNYVGFKLALYLGANPNIDAQIKQGYHLVTRCARSGEGLFLETLLKFGGDVHANLPNGGYFPIHMSATKGHAISIEILMKYGADIHAIYELPEISKNLQYPLGWTALICACIHDKTEAGKKLLDLGANPLDTNEKGMSAVKYLPKK